MAIDLGAAGQRRRLPVLVRHLGVSGEFFDELLPVKNGNCAERIFRVGGSHVRATAITMSDRTCPMSLTSGALAPAATGGLACVFGRLL
jgi:hypothetical protein